LESFISLLILPILSKFVPHTCKYWSYRGRDHMVVGFTTTYAIIAYHH
jgi:hypothetical protein